MLASLGGSAVKNPPAKAEDSGLIPDLGRSPGEENGIPTPVLLPGEPHEQRSPVIHGVAESDMTW